MCNKVLSTGVFPDRLKYLEIKPLFNEGNKTGISNHFPAYLFF